MMPGDGFSQVTIVDNSGAQQVGLTNGPIVVPVQIGHISILL
jgi:hypothetical protein